VCLVLVQVRLRKFQSRPCDHSAPANTSAASSTGAVAASAPTETAVTLCRPHTFLAHALATLRTFRLFLLFLLVLSTLRSAALGLISLAPVSLARLPPAWRSPASAPTDTSQSTLGTVVSAAAAALASPAVALTLAAAVAAVLVAAIVKRTSADYAVAVLGPTPQVLESATVTPHASASAIQH